MGKRTDFSQMNCSLARSMEIFGDRWTMMVLRDLCFGINQFQDIQTNLGIARNILSNRLQWLVEQGMVEKRVYGARSDRYEYLPTEKALDLVPAMIAIIAWGDRWTADETGPPIFFTHDHCEGPIEAEVICQRCGQTIRSEGLHHHKGNNDS
ncbi:MAG: helix-turn-helix domain-containing protein [Chloroflexota bacterium]